MLINDLYTSWLFRKYLKTKLFYKINIVSKHVGLSKININLLIFISIYVHNIYFFKIILSAKKSFKYLLFFDNHHLLNEKYFYLLDYEFYLKGALLLVYLILKFWMTNNIALIQLNYNYL